MALESANLIAVIGAFGSGKSLFMCTQAIDLAEKNKLKIVTNVAFNKKAFLEYCRFKKYKWCLNCRIIYIDCHKVGIEPLLSYPDSVVIFDEAGVHLNSRYWKVTSRLFLDTLFQVRHDNIILLCGFQFPEQVDKQLRELIQWYVICTSIAPRRLIDGKLRPYLLSYWRHHFDSRKFIKREFEKPNAFKEWLMAVKVEHRLLGLDRLRFAILKLVYILCWLFDSGISRYMRPLPNFPKLPEDYVFAIYSSFSASASRAARESARPMPGLARYPGLSGRSKKVSQIVDLDWLKK